MAKNITPNTSPRVPNAAAPSPRRWRDLILPASFGLFVLFGFAALALATGWTDTWQALQRLSLNSVALLLGLSLVNYIARGLRWHLFTRHLNLPTGLTADLRHFLGGLAMTVTPGRLGEVIRMQWLRRETGQPLERTAPLLLVDRAYDLIAMALLLGLSLALSSTGVTGGLPVIIVSLTLAFALTRPRLLKGMAELGHRFTSSRKPRLFARIRRAAEAMAAFNRKRLFMLALGLGLVGWFAEGFGLYLVLGWMGAETNIWKALSVFVIATISGGLTGAPGGLGGAEAAMVGLLVLDGVPVDIALPATLVIRLTTLWFAVLIGSLVFPIAEIQSKKRRDALET